MLTRFPVSRCCCAMEEQQGDFEQCYWVYWGYDEDNNDAILTWFGSWSGGLLFLGRTERRTILIQTPRNRRDSAASVILDIPQGATIVSAKLHLAIYTYPYYQTPNQYDVIGEVYVRNVDQGTAVLSSATAILAWTLVPGHVDYQFFDTAAIEIGSLVQAVIDRPGWVSGNYLNLRLKTALGSPLEADPAGIQEPMWMGNGQNGSPLYGKNYMEVSWIA